MNSLIPHNCICHPVAHGTFRVTGARDASNYRGYLPIETLVVKVKPYNPFKEVPVIMTKLNKAQKAVFK